MEATGNSTTAISATYEAGKQASGVFYTVYEGYISRLVVAQSLVVLYAKYVCVLLPLVILNIRYVHLGLIYID